MSPLRRYLPILARGVEYSGGSHGIEGRRHE